jgi:hypothetical protein
MKYVNQYINITNLTNRKYFREKKIVIYRRLLQKSYQCIFFYSYSSAKNLVNIVFILILRYLLYVSSISLRRSLWIFTVSLFQNF